MAAYYNEIKSYAAKWIRKLIAAGQIPDGDVDERSIEDVRPDDLRGYTQHHFFAGIGGWALALRRAGWPDDRPVWTGSCPCQPFSQAGQGAGFDDERHLWPAWQWLISQRRPAEILGEQVASKDVEPWIDLVSTDLEGLGYAVGTTPFPAAGIGAPNIRDRAYFMAYANHTRSQGRRRVLKRPAECPSGPSGMARVVADDNRLRLVAHASTELRYDKHNVEPCGGAGIVADSHREPTGRIAGGSRRSQAEVDGPSSCNDHRSGNAGDVSGMADSDSVPRGQGSSIERRRNHGGHEEQGTGSWRDGGARIELPGPVNGFWRDSDWLFCRDEKWRPVEPGTFPLVAGLPRGMGNLSAEQVRLAGLAGLDAASLKRAKAYRVGTLHGYGNAINVEAAATFIAAARETIDA